MNRSIELPDNEQQKVELATEVIDAKETIETSTHGALLEQASKMKDEHEVHEETQTRLDALRGIEGAQQSEFVPTPDSALKTTADFAAAVDLESLSGDEREQADIVLASITLGSVVPSSLTQHGPSEAHESADLSA